MATRQRPQRESLGKSETRADRVIRWVETVCRVPEGRLVGQPVRLREWQRREVRRIYDNPAGTRRAILSFGRKNGKGLALDTPIPTPSGWRTMADIEEGDEVYGSDGKPTRVIGVSSIHTGLRCWRLTFSDGSTIVADERHQWLTTHSYRPWAAARVNGSGNGGRWRTEVVTTPQIALSVHRARRDGGVEHNHKIRIAGPIEAPNRDLPIDPYVLGAWLGDGKGSGAVFYAGDSDVEHLAEQLAVGGHPATLRSAKTCWELRASRCRQPGSLQSLLRQLGVLGNKHIPDAYLSAGTAQRWALLQGLMDTDGTSSSGAKTRQCQFVNVSERLATDVWRLIRTLGIKGRIKEGPATLNGEVVGRAFSITFNASRDQPVFRLQRKQERLPETLSGRGKTLSIVTCDPVPSVPTKCIAVAAPNKLYLAGHGCVPTHNTALSAFLLLVHLCGPEARANSQLFSAAQSRDQAAILFSLAAKIVRMSPELRDYVIPRDTAKQLYCPDLGTLYRALSADATTAYGLSPAFTVHDELGQVRGPRSELYEALETATAAQDDPLSIVISTQAPTDADLLSMLIDDALAGHDPRVVVSLYTAPQEDSPFDEATIRLANPAFGDFQNASEVLAMAEDARRMPSREAEYRNLILNQRVEASAPLFSRSVWEACSAPVKPLDGVPVYGGLDLSAVNDLTAFVLIGKVDGVWQVHPTFWLPADGIADRARTDRVPYDIWYEQGYLRAAPGRTVDYEFVAHYVRDACARYDVRKIGFDRWNFKHLRPWLVRAGFSEDEIDDLFEEVGQGFASMSPAMRDLESEVLNGRLAHGGHPVLRNNIANSVVKADPSGNRKLDKAKSTGRIDGAVALLDAMAVAPTADEPNRPQLFFLGAA